jgi:hypothetical protein
MYAIGVAAGWMLASEAESGLIVGEQSGWKWHDLQPLWLPMRRAAA